jgi:hypothetical protein
MLEFKVRFHGNKAHAAGGRKEKSKLAGPADLEFLTYRLTALRCLLL